MDDLEAMGGAVSHVSNGPYIIIPISLAVILLPDKDLDMDGMGRCVG